jgi:hypothetical protein
MDKHFWKRAGWTWVAVILAIYATSRLAPGLATRAGLIGRPAFAFQFGWAEPFGMIPVISPGFTNWFAYGYPPIWRAQPGAPGVLGTPTGQAVVAQGAVGAPSPASGGSATDLTIATTT